jgi:proline iminopeptidase
MASLTTPDGRTLAWREAGSGPPLLCHPGGPGFSSVYFGELPELAAARTLLLLDPRGTGASDRPTDPSDYDLEQYVADVEAVREDLGMARIDVLGHSHGGFVAMSWAATHPHRVGRLVLSNTTPRFTDAIRQARRQRAGSHRGQPYFEDAMDALRAHQAGEYETDEELAALYQREARVFVPVGVEVTVAFDALARAGTNADALRHFNEHVAPGMDLRPSLGRIEAPALVVGGELDPFGRSTQEELAGALSDVMLVILPGVDHFPFLETVEHREAWSRTVLDFLAAG